MCCQEQAPWFTRLGGRPTRRPSTFHNIHIKKEYYHDWTYDNNSTRFLMVAISVGHAHNLSEMFTYEFLACQEWSWEHIKWKPIASCKTCKLQSKSTSKGHGGIGNHGMIRNDPKSWNLRNYWKEAPERLKRHNLHAATLDVSKITQQHYTQILNKAPTSVA